MYGKYPAACLLIVSCSCADFGPDNSGKVVISTDKSSYCQSETITFTVQNWGDAVAYIWHCNYRLGFGIQKQENGSWSTFKDRNQACIAIYRNGAMPIPFGQPYIDTLSLHIPGDYRIEMDVGWDPDHIHEYQIYSNSFRVE